MAALVADDSMRRKIVAKLIRIMLVVLGCLLFLWTFGCKVEMEGLVDKISDDFLVLRTEENKVMFDKAASRAYLHLREVDYRYNPLLVFAGLVVSCSVASIVLSVRKGRS